jgi:RNA polymerase-binding protein DksA
MHGNWPKGLRELLEQKKAELDARLNRITANVRQTLETDSKERAKQMEDSEVVDALGNEAREELNKISVALMRMDKGDYGLCSGCGIQIQLERIRAYPYANECIDCANMDEKIRAREFR